MKSKKDGEGLKNGLSPVFYFFKKDPHQKHVANGEVRNGLY